GFVEAVREAVEQAVIVRRVAALQRVEKDERAAGLEQPRDLAGDGAALARRQLVEKIDRGDDVEAGIGAGHVLGGGGDELAARPRRQQMPRLGEIERAEIERG